MILTCRQLVEAVTEAREGTLSRLDAFGYRAHLLRCGACRRYVKQMEDTVELLGALPRSEEAAPAELKAALMAQLAARAPKPGSG